MATAIAPVLYTETRLNIEPTSSSSILHIPTDSSSSIFALRRRSRGTDNDASQDEETFSRRHLAIESSIFFRSQGRTPRSILWRVLDDRKSLELQSVDLTQDRKTAHESLLTFSLSFASPIRPNGVAFADNGKHDAIEVFVLSTNNELFTFSFRRELLLRSTVPAASDLDPTTCFRSFYLASFSFRHPYRLVALSDLVLAVSLHDGALLRLERREGENGTMWRETFFHEGGWGSSLRGLIPWKSQNTIQFGDLDLAPSTAAAVAASPTGEHVFTVSLDHTLKAWNASTGKVGLQMDLLGEQKADGRTSDQYLINPNHSSLMKILDVPNKPDGDSYYCVVYSPKDHRFKFWAVRDPDSAEHGVRDVQPDLSLIPPFDELMDTKVWHLADFDLKAGEGWHNTQLWIRARSGAQCQTFTVIFDLLESSDEVEYSWKHQWTSVSKGTLDIENLCSTAEFKLLLQDSEGEQSVSTSEKWLDFLTYPGRFTTSSLETALHIYRSSQSGSKSAKIVSLNSPYQERLRSAIEAKIGLTRTADGHVDRIRFAKDINAQWKSFCGLVVHLHQRRSDSLAMSLDPATGLCWSIRADQIAPIRRCSHLEVYTLNEDLFIEQDDDWILNSFPLADFLPNDLVLIAARLLSAARSFRAGLSGSFNHKFSRLASAFALRDASSEVDHRGRKHANPLHLLYERCDFGNEVGDDEFNQLTESVEDLGGLGLVENNRFEAIILKLAESTRGQQQEVALSHYGDKTTIRVAQDTLLEGKETLLDLLALATFMSQDLETDELARGFKPLELYLVIANKLREIDVLLWMASNTRTERSQARRSSGGDSFGQSQHEAAEPSMTILESVFIGDWPSMSFPEEPMANLITYWSRAWTFGPSLDVEYDGVTAHVMSNLLKHENYRLAMGFVRFLPNNSWTTYLKGRMLLGEGEHASAAACFRRAAKDLSETSDQRLQPMETVDTASLLSATQKQCFNAGTPRFYLHCSSLFENSKLPSFAADFAGLALRDIEEQSGDTLDSSMMDIDNRKRSMLDSPASVRVDLAMEEIRILKASELKEEILSRLFNASLQTNRYQAAFEALTKFTNPAIKRASLTQLLTSILTTTPSLLLSFPFPSDLVSEVDRALLSLSRKRVAGSPASSASDRTPSYHGILYSWRISQENYRGAAEGLYERLQALKSSSEEARVAETAAVANEAEDILDTYLLLINTLACCGPDEGWILAEPPNQAGSSSAISPSAKRKIVTLDHVRAEYQAELDRRSEIAHGRFALFADGAAGADQGMQVDVF
ncbi:hypothetical protein ANO11243_064920 [Dothideomycetidae sp. 11243]|nr:hypothetical protein ANO11243_064920 [fungal sp. No.11243]